MIVNDDQKKALEAAEQQIRKQYQQRKNCFLPGQVKKVLINGEPESLAISPKWEGQFNFKAGFITSDWRYDPIVNPESGELNAGLWMGDLCALMDIEQQLKLASWLLDKSAVGIKMAGVTKNTKGVIRFTEALEKHLEIVQKIQIEFNDDYQDKMAVRHSAQIENEVQELAENQFIKHSNNIKLLLEAVSTNDHQLKNDILNNLKPWIQQVLNNAD